MDDMLGRSAAAASTGAGNPFDAYYFEHNCGVPYRRDSHWLTFFGGIADQIVARIGPRRALDAGCALGILVEALRTRGVDAFGVDVSSYAIDNVYEPIRPFCRLGSIADDFSDRYDLIVSIEVVEHMGHAEAEQAVANFCRHTDDVLFSSTPGDHRELTHVNVQPPEYWAELFARHGFFRDVDFDASFINPWAVRFRRSGEPLPRIVRDYERAYAQLSIARADARQCAAELQRDLGEALARGSAGEERAHLQSVIAQIRELAAALDEQRNALLASRLDLDRERERTAQAGAVSRHELERERQRLAAAAEADRAQIREKAAALERERAALAGKAADESQQLRTLREALEETHAHLSRKIVELDEARAQAAEAVARAHAVDHAGRQARDTIQLMEQSAFWRARLAINRVLGRRR